MCFTSFLFLKQDTETKFNFSKQANIRLFLGVQCLPLRRFLRRGRHWTDGESHSPFRGIIQPITNCIIRFLKGKYDNKRGSRKC